MGHNRRFRRVEDAARYGGDIAVQCPRCRREVIFDRETFLAILHWKRVSTDREIAGARLRCTACGRRGCIIELAAPDLPGRLKLHDGDRLPPDGISISQWCTMGWHERKRYIRMLR